MRRMEKLHSALILRGDPLVTAELAPGAAVTLDPLQVSAPGLAEPVDIEDGASLIDHSTLEVYDLPALLRDLAATPGPVPLAPYAVEEGD